MPNYLGTATGLTGIPTLLISTLQAVKDPDIQKALYQIQNWANSFFTWNYAVFDGPYSTGGVTLTFPRPFASTIEGLVATPITTSSVVSLAIPSLSVTLSQFSAQLFTTSAELGNGLTCGFSYIAVGH